jgi:hypothetical protein
MNFSECGLRLHVSEEGGVILLTFWQVTLGFEGYLCSIRRKRGVPFFDQRPDDSPDPITKALFRLIYGLKGFRVDCSIRSDDCEQECIRFFRCSDRKGQTRTFVSATERPGREAGGSFISDERDFEEVLRRLKQIESKERENSSGNSGPH